MTKPLRVLLLVPLQEEFAYVCDCIPITDGDLQQTEFVYDLRTDDDLLVIRAVVLGEAGTASAAHRTERLLASERPDLVVLIGVAGCLSDDLRLADVVVADSIDDYLANSKAKTAPAEPNSYYFEVSGKVTRTSHALVQAVRNFQFAAPKLFAQWQEAAVGERTPVRLHVGHLASGNTVSTSDRFVSFLRGLDRKYLAVEMESAGVAESTFGQLTPVPLLVLRGISDRSDQAKSTVDASTNDWRKLAVYNAIRFALKFLAWDKVRTLLTNSHTNPPLHETHLAEVEAFINGDKE